MKVTKNLRIVPLMLLLVPTTIVAATLPDAPDPVVSAPAPAVVVSTRMHLPRTDLYLLGGDAVTRALDTISTYRAVQNPNVKEQNLGQYMAHHPWVMGAYSGGVVTAEYFAVRELEKHHHHLLAMAVPSVDIIYDGSCVVHNFEQPQARGGTLPVSPIRPRAEANR